MNGPIECCAFCGQGSDHAGLGPLLGPLGARYYVHRACALWSPEVHQSEDGTLLRVLEAVRRGRQLACTYCGRRGASLGCRVERCKTSMHVLCAQQAGATFYVNHCVACQRHARRFKNEPALDQLLYAGAPSIPADEAAALAAGGTPARLNDAAWMGPSPERLPPGAADTRPAKRRRLAAAHDRAERAKAVIKRVRGSTRRIVDPGSDDEGHFRNKEAARLQRDIARLNPLTLHQAHDGAGPAAVQHVYIKPAKGGPKLAPPQVAPSDTTAAVRAVLDCDLSSLAGADEAVTALRELVLLPLTYPSLFKSMGLALPSEHALLWLHHRRGILLHGAPGTGKTLAARALAGECARRSPVPLTFFARKGADCLGKFVGEAERTLRLLFQEAQRCAPSIVFFDEIDALTPPRGAGAGAQDQIHASVVSTLLSLMDGLTDRGNVVVLATTNRLEAVDPALRRPGRFDREVRFGLPATAQRLDILRVHTARWQPRPLEDTLVKVAAATEGYAGADLAALATAAVLAAAHRAAPQLLQDAMLVQEEEEVEEEEEEWKEGGLQVGTPLAARPEQAAAEDTEEGAAGLVEEEEEGAADEEAAAEGGTEAAPRIGASQGGASQGGEEDGAVHQAERLQQEVGAGEERRVAETRRQRLLRDVSVEGTDWEATLAAAPAPCSRREGLAALEADAARPIAHHLAPLLLPPLRLLLEALHDAAVPLPPSAQIAAALAHTGPSDALEAHLQQLRAVLPPIGSALPALAGPTGPLAAATPSLQSSRAATHQPCRVLLVAHGECGQEAVAGAALRVLEGCPVHVINLPAIVVHGAGDAPAGAVALVSEALRRGDRRQALVLFLPRVEGWAVDAGEEEEAQEGRAQHVGSPARPAGPSPGKRDFASAPSPFGGLVSMERRGAAGGAAGGSGMGRAEGATPQVSPAWAAFRSTLQQAPPTQPLVVVATCHCHVDSLPAEVAAFLTQGGAAVYVDNGSQADRDAAAGRAVAAAASAVGVHAAAAFLERMQRAWTGAAGGGDAAAAGGGGAATPSPVTDGIMGPQSERRIRHAGADVSLPRGSHLFNAAELDRGRFLCAQVMRFITALGRRLLRDRRCREAAAWVAGRPGRHGGSGSDQLFSFADVATRAAQGGITSLDALRAAAAQVAQGIQGAAQASRRGSGDVQLRHPDAASLAHALQDEVDSRCCALWQQLGLSDQRTALLLAHAEGQVQEILHQQAEAAANSGHATPAAQGQSGLESDDLVVQAVAGGTERPELGEVEATLAGGRLDMGAVQAGGESPPEPDSGSDQTASAAAAALAGEGGSEEGGPAASRGQGEQDDQQWREIQAMGAEAGLLLEKALLQGASALQLRVESALRSAGVPPVAALQQAVSSGVQVAVQACTAAVQGGAVPGSAPELAEVWAGAVAEALR